MILCFGTFASILRLCKLPGVTDPQLVGTMTKTVDPNCRYISPDNATAISRLLSCTGGFSTGRSKGGSGAMKAGEGISDVVQLAKSETTDNIVGDFQIKVLELLDEDKKALAVLALMDIIRQDETLDGTRKHTFEKYLGIKKDALLAQSELLLSHFLAGLFLYTVVIGKNTDGRECVKTINEDYLASLGPQKDTIKLSEEIPVFLYDDIKPYGPSLTFEDIDGGSSSIPSVTDPDYSDYLRNAKGKYSMIKTLLYSDQPRPFYDFYVCNDIEHHFTVQRNGQTEYRLDTISDATVESLAKLSNFIIISGTGGLGKSMMMRHLLLSSIERYGITCLLPIFVQLKDYDESSGGILDYIYSKVDCLCSNVTKRQFTSTLSTGKCILLLDGLDEIKTEYSGRFEQDLEVFTDKYSTNTFVISSRPYQQFVSYARFTHLLLQPFTKEQALTLVDNLEFRPDEPTIKAKFRRELDSFLYRTHREFIANPLLLTIMLMTFEQFAEVPSKMHIFYREAYLALSQKHDASKGAYRRKLKTGLTADKFADYFGELCARSYCDEKFELTMAEFDSYYSKLRERARSNDSVTTARDFLDDLCNNMCLMYFEGGKYHFTHRSFQEYFCACHFSKQKDRSLGKIGDVFEKMKKRMSGDQAFQMLFDMIPEKIEEYLFVPFLNKLFAECDEGDGFWTFLERIHPEICYGDGENDVFLSNDPSSYIFTFIRSLCGLRCDLTNEPQLPSVGSLITREYVYEEQRNGESKLVDREDISLDYIAEYGMPDIVGWSAEFEVEEVRKNPDEYNKLLEALEGEECPFMIEYVAVRNYYGSLLQKQKQTAAGADLFDQL